MDTTLVATTEHEVTWSEKPPEVPTRHFSPPDVMESVARGVEQAARGEGVELHEDDLPIDEDDA